jgi:anti-sigma factor RsiW
MGCGFEEELTAYVDGELRPPRAEEVRGHLPSCASCRATEALLRRTVERLAALPEPAFAPTPRLRRELLARLDEPQGRWAAWMKALRRPAVLLPSFGLAAALALVVVAVTRGAEAPDSSQLELASNLEVARNLDVLEDLDVLDVDNPDDFDVVANLKELEVTP